MKSVPLEMCIRSQLTHVYTNLNVLNEYKCMLAFFGLYICSMAEVIQFDRLKTGFWIGGIDGSTNAHKFSLQNSYSHYISKKNFWLLRDNQHILIVSRFSSFLSFCFPLNFAFVLENFVM